MAGPWVEASDLDDANDPNGLAAVQAASSILYALSGRKYRGLRELTERYEPPDTCEYVATNVADAVRRRYFGDGFCSYHRRGRLALRDRPVRSVQNLVVYPETSPRTVDGSEYEVVDRRYLRPKYGASWSPCMPFDVTYTAGTPIPAAGKRAASILANELLKARNGDKSCNLPDRVTNLTRQGVSFTILDPQDFLKEGRTGLYEVDLFVAAVNPDQARKRARVFSPDLPRAGRITS
jgi:hypothetical protein